MILLKEYSELHLINEESKFLESHYDCLPIAHSRNGKMTINQDDLLFAFQTRKSYSSIAWSLYLNGLILYVRDLAQTSVEPLDSRLKRCAESSSGHITVQKCRENALSLLMQFQNFLGQSTTF